MASEPTNIRIPRDQPPPHVPSGRRGDPHPMSYYECERDNEEPPTPTPDVYKAYAALQVELDQKIDIIKGLHWSISRAKTFQPSVTLDDLRSQHSAALEDRDARIIHLQNINSVRQDEIDRLRESVDLRTDYISEQRHLEILQGRDLHIDNLKTQIHSLHEQLEKEQ